MKLLTPARYRVLSGVFANLSAGWLGAILIVPNFSDLTSIKGKWVLTGDVGLAMICLIVAFWLEEKGAK